MPRRRFVLADPCLTGPGSHPLALAAEVLQAAAGYGFDVTLVAHRGFDAAAAAAAWPTIAAFEHTAYSKYTAAGELDRLDTHGREPWWRRLSWSRRHARRRRRERIAAFARDLAPVISRLQPGDVVLVATASELEVAGLAEAIAAGGVPLGVGWHCLLHFPILRGFAADFPRQWRRLDRVRRLLTAAAARAAPHALHLHATTAELAAHHAALGAGPVGVLPYPIAMPAAAGDRPSRGLPLRVACLGDMRPEKGSAALADLVAAAGRDRALAPAVRWLIQSNCGFAESSRAPEHLAVRGSLARIAARASSGDFVALLPGPLDAGAYQAALTAADVMLLPYDQDRYRVRLSAITLESLAAAAVPIVTGGGWMARQLADPHRAHAAGVIARSHVVADRRLHAPRLTARPLVIDLPAAPDHDGAFVAVTVRWPARADAPLDREPLRVSAGGFATVAAADPEGRAVTVLAPAAAAGPVVIAATCGGSRAEPAEVVIERRTTATRPPAAAVGLVIDSPADAPGALREIVRHAPHYRGTAAAHAAVVRAACGGEPFLRRLLG